MRAAIERIVAHVNIDMIGATRAPGRADANSADATGPNGCSRSDRAR